MQIELHLVVYNNHRQLNDIVTFYESTDHIFVCLNTILVANKMRVFNTRHLLSKYLLVSDWAMLGKVAVWKNDQELLQR